MSTDKRQMRLLGAAGVALLGLTLTHGCPDSMLVQPAQTQKAERAQPEALTVQREITKSAVQEAAVPQEELELPVVNPDWELQKLAEEMEGGKEEIYEIQGKLADLGYSFPDDENPSVERSLLDAMPGEHFTIEKDGYRAGVKLRQRYDTNDELYFEGEMTFFLGYDHEARRVRTERKNISADTQDEVVQAIDEEMKAYIAAR